MPRELSLLGLWRHAESLLGAVDMPHANRESLNPVAIDLFSLTAVVAGAGSWAIFGVLSPAQMPAAP
jgi:hypothetical protein